jgi:hypothetical protein
VGQINKERALLSQVRFPHEWAIDETTGIGVSCPYSVPCLITKNGNHTG